MHKGRIPGSTYHYAVTSVRSNLESPLSAEAQASPTATASTPATVSLAISGAPTISFPATALTVQAQKTLTVTNSGTATATLGTVTTAGLGLTGDFSLTTGGSCLTGGSVASNATCTLMLVYAPTAIGPASTNLTLSYTGAGKSATATAALTGSVGNGQGLHLFTGFGGRHELSSDDGRPTMVLGGERQRSTGPHYLRVIQPTAAPGDRIAKIGGADGRRQFLHLRSIYGYDCSVLGRKPIGRFRQRVIARRHC